MLKCFILETQVKVIPKKTLISLGFVRLLFLIDYLITLSGPSHHVFGMFPHTIETIWKSTKMTIKSSFFNQFS